MKNNKLWMLAAILICGLGMMLTACSSSDTVESEIVDGGEDVTPDDDGEGDITPATGKVVVMYYAVGGGDIDNDVEWGLGKMGLEQLKGDGVRTFVQMKYSSKRHNDWGSTYEPSGDYGCVYRFELNKSSLNPDYKGELDEPYTFKGEGFKKFAGKDFKMYDPDNLVAFINWCMEQAPGAKAYVLAFGNHGGGYGIGTDYNKSLTRGVLYDDNLKNACMSPTEIRTALNKLTRKPDMVFFDLCIMNTLEVLGELQGCTNFVFASGHPVLQTPLELLCVALECVAKSDDDVAESIKKNMTDCVINITQEMEEKLKNEKGTRYKRSMDYTLTDMSKMPALLASIKAVTDFLVKTDISGIDVDLFDEAASGCYHYVDTDPYFDVVSYLNQLKENVFPDNAEFAGLVSQVETAVKACHVAHEEFSYDKNGTDKKYGLSYSIYLGFSSSRLIFDNPEVKDYAPKEPMGVIMQTCMGGKGTADDPYYNSYILENGQCFLTNWQGKREATSRDITMYYAEGSDANLSWDNTYRTLLFDKATGWSNWMKKNPGISFDNPPYDDEYTYVFERPTWNELTGE